MVQTKLRLLSADNHIVEPPDLWTDRIEPKFRALAPRLVPGDKVGREPSADWWMVEENRCVGSVGLSTHAGERFKTDRPDEISVRGRYDKVRPGSYDPHEAIKDMEVDGVAGGVIFPTLGVGGMWQVENSELLSAICRTYNDWIAEFCQPYPERLAGACMINLDDIQAGVDELHRSRKLGLRAAVIAVHPAHERQYHNPEYEPFWAAAQDLDMPLCLHSGSNRTGRDGVPTDHYNQTDPHEPLGIVYANMDNWIRRSLTSMILSKVFERFPRLKVLSVENLAGWAAHWLYTLDLGYKKPPLSPWGRFKGDALPSDFFHRNCGVTFQDDWTASAMRSIIGVDNLLWGSDYPHQESTWPESQRVIREIFEGVPEEELRKITSLNLARIFGFNGA